MNQCVPSWDLGGNPTPRLALRTNSNSNSNSVTAADVPTLDYEVAELTWENGQLAMHGLGPPRLLTKQLPTGGTLESIVNQATTAPAKGKSVIGTGNELVPWFEEQRRAVTSAATASASMTLTMDALVPCSNPAGNSMAAAGMNTCMVGCSTRVGSCNDKVREARVPHEWSSRPAASVSGSATWGFDSRQLTLDTFEKEREFCTATGFTSTSMGSQGNTSSDKQYTKTLDEHDSVCHSRNQREAGDEADKKKGSGKLSVSTKRSRAAAIHNQSERKRRDKINQRMKTLQKLVPNSSKTDKASMLDEVIEYLKQLQGQVNMMSRMNMSPMMLPLAMQQQQLQMSMMAPMMNLAGMGLGVMDINAAMASRPNIAGIPPAFNPAAFLPGALTSWDGSGDRLASSSSAMPDPLSAFLACQSPPMTMDAYSRMAAISTTFRSCL